MSSIGGFVEAMIKFIRFLYRFGEWYGTRMGESDQCLIEAEQRWIIINNGQHSYILLQDRMWNTWRHQMDQDGGQMFILGLTY